MSANAEPIYWPEPLSEIEEEDGRPTRQKILHFRHTVGDCDVTHLILDSREESEPTAR